ncbi:MAG: maleylpyruvate isomerase family mycothiol-dependent enzyme [Nocardiopsaceae bacterium]|jgi:uncharacterized protein (TIGR03083 family)|nr:maleylpyruvate isomerase family mycothiol-dependent enzyme [Nocardiopsaceae bacterium]
MTVSDRVFELIAVERRRAADMFASLSDEQWQVRSLCSEWTVRDVAGHLIGPFCGSVLKFVIGGIREGSFHRYSTRMSRQLAKRPTAELVAILRANADSRYAPPGTGPPAALTDLAVHTRDVARPLGLSTTASADAWRQVLEFLTSPRAARGFTRRGSVAGLRLTAADQEWSHGDGPEVRGPSEALALAIAGRETALADLSGDGLPTLTARVTGSKG